MHKHLCNNIFLSTNNKVNDQSNRPIICCKQQYVFKLFVCLHGEYNTSLDLWKHHVNLLLQSFRSVSSDLHHYQVINIISNSVISINSIQQKICISADEGPRLRIESFAIINSRGISTKLY